MTFKESTGNLLDADAEALVNTVNTVGVMGKGIALQFKKAFPENFRAYEAACRRDEVRLGEIFVYSTGKLTENPRFILNFPTKEHWRSKARLIDIERGLKDLVNQIQRLQVISIAIPPLGCGLGGLQWSQVEPLIRTAFAPLKGVEVAIYAPVGTPSAAEMPDTTSKPELTRIRTAILATLARYSGLVGRGATPVEVQKLSYLLERVGEPLNLGFEKGMYGPYSKTLEHVLGRLDAHYLSGFGDRSQRVDEAERIVVVEDVLSEIDDAAARYGVTSHVDLVLKMVEGFNSAYGTELLATVDWVVSHETERQGDPETVFNAIQVWNRRKARIFTIRHVDAALARLDSYELVSV